MSCSKSCSTTREELVAYLDRELPDQEALDVERHLHACAACREELAGLKKANRYLDHLPRPATPSPDFVERFWRRIGTGKGRRAVPWALPVALAGLAAAVLVIAVVLGSRGADSLGTPQGDPEAALLSEEEREIVAQLEILEADDFEAAERYPILSSLPAVEELEEREVEILSKEGSE